MLKKFLSVTCSLTAAFALVSCGGSDGDSPCGSASQLFGISFAQSTYTIPINKSANITSTVQPESCRSSMSFAVHSGNLPPGLSVAKGNVSGTPTLAGSYAFNVAITKIDGYIYSYFPPFVVQGKAIDGSGIWSGTITVKVTP